ncbi:MAG: T9SS type A sorting domain-containing protein [Candidatus Marinimicrobia bacterium]|nr:T9SS type A sorting domain-containing protein [Candidatus Neomarinimicrobiota bacterium]
MGTDIINENILPPGQSGFINAQGVPSPHFDNQWPLHLAWEYKDQLFGPGCKIGGEVEASVPSHFCLYQNYPNPFNSVTTIRFDLPEAADVKIAVYDILGREIAVLVSGKIPASPLHIGTSGLSGEYKVEWDANNIPSGVYFYHLQIKKGGLISYEKTEKMLLLK